MDGLGLAALNHPSDAGGQGLSLVVWCLAPGDVGRGIWCGVEHGLWEM